MISLRRVLAIFVGLLVAGLVLNRTWADGPAAPAPSPDGVEVEVKLADRSTLKGRFTTPSVPIKLDYGRLELSVTKIKQIDLVPAENNSITAIILATDKNQLTGTLLASEFSITGHAEPLKAADLRAVKFLHPKDLSLFAAILGLLTLTLMEIVLGVDNIIFLAIVAGKLPQEQQPKARRIGLAAALGTRLLLLASLSFLLKLTEPLFFLPALPFLESLEARGISGRDLILLVGGIFLIGKSVKEMHDKVEHAKSEEAGQPLPPKANFWAVIAQIAVIDIIFSLDSVITAVGMVDDLWVMITAMLIAVGVMVVFAEPIAHFVEKRPTVKILALSFLILIGVLLVAEGLGQHLNKGYIYFAMGFGVCVELINMQFSRKATVLNVLPG